MHRVEISFVLLLTAMQVVTARRDKWTKEMAQREGEEEEEVEDDEDRPGPSLVLSGSPSCCMAAEFSPVEENHV